MSEQATKWQRSVPPTLNHTAKNRKFCTYSVWKNLNDETVIIDGTAEECAKAMGIGLNSFYDIFSKTRLGKTKKWKIIKRYLDGRPTYTKWEKAEEKNNE